MKCCEKDPRGRVLILPERQRRRKEVIKHRPQIWLDAGDGKAAERLQNATLRNETLTDAEIKGFITDNADLWFYEVKKIWHPIFDVVHFDTI